MSKAENVISDIAICEDCRQMTANATLGSEDHEADNAHAEKMVALWGDGWRIVPPSGDGHFSDRWCDGCGSQLAGDRYVTEAWL